MEKRIEEFCEASVGLAFQRLQELQPGDRIVFVGLPQWAKELVTEAEKLGLKIQAHIKDDFNEHLLVVLGRHDVESEKISPQANTLLMKFRVTFGSLLSLFKGGSL